MNQNSTAFPLSLAIAPSDDIYTSVSIDNGGGLTKREYAAIHIMSGLLANSAINSQTPEKYASYAVSYVDALLEKLEHLESPF